jgi:hypothetical protein
MEVCLPILNLLSYGFAHYSSLHLGVYVEIT